MIHTLIRLLPGILYIIPQTIIFIACIIYLEKNKSKHAKMLMIGSSITLLETVLYSLVFPILSDILNMNFYSGTFNVFTLGTPITFIGTILFAIGLLQLIKDKIKLQQSI